MSYAYKNHTVVGNSDGKFLITNKETSDSVEVNINGYDCNYLNLDKLGLNINDFNEAPINKFGLKEVARYQDEVLVLTANGLFVIYSGGLPSLPGLPCEIGPVSGMWVDDEGTVKSYPFSLYPKVKLINFMTRFSDLSFREINLDFTHMMYKIQTTDWRSHEKTIVDDCNYFCDSLRVSRYIDLYPGFTEATIRRYKCLLRRNKYMLGDSCELLPIVLLENKANILKSC